MTLSLNLKLFCFVPKVNTNLKQINKGLFVVIFGLSYTACPNIGDQQFKQWGELIGQIREKTDTKRGE